ncbi:MAG: ABC transporter permease, partial [Chitinophagales bacterium]
YIADLSPISINENIDTEAPLYLDAENYSYIKIITIGSKSLVLKIPYFGRSFQSNKPVLSILQRKILPTALLAIFAMGFASIIGISLGIFAALRHNTWLDRSVVGFSVLGISVPSYFSAIILAVLFGYYLSNYTGLNVTGPLIDVSDLGEYFINWRNLILPVIALGIRPVAIIVQLTRNSMLDVLGADYVRTAKAKGLSRKKVILKHALRNALNPVVTSVTGWFAALLAGAFFVEWVFDFKGLGHETVNALLQFDFPLVMGAILFIAFVFVIMNIVVDFLYTLLDPRVKIDA